MNLNIGLISFFIHVYDNVVTNKNKSGKNHFIKDSKYETLDGYKSEEL